MIFHEPLGGAKGIGRSKIFQRNSSILIADLDSLQKSMNVKWFPFFYLISVSASKLANTADFRLVVHLLANFGVFGDFNNDNIKIYQNKVHFTFTLFCKESKSAIQIEKFL